MFMLTAAEADLIRAAWDSSGELGAAVELRRLFPGITDNENARRCARAIASWPPRDQAPVPDVKPVRRGPARKSAKISPEPASPTST